MSPQSVLVFGGARGIGGATVEAFAAHGAAVLIADVLDAEGHELAERLGPHVTFLHVDVADPDHIAKAYDAIRSRHGRLDVVLNNVGIARYGRVTELSLNDWELSLRVNVTAQFLSAKHAIPLMCETGGGTIVNTASVLAHGSQKTTAAYSASKCAVIGLTRTIAIDHAVDGIRCISISPGTIDTPLVAIAAQTFPGKDPDELRTEWANAHPMKRLGSADEVAALIVFLSDGGANFITGTDILIDGGITSELYA